jgi:thiol:disulfide interchange protein DsbD
MPSRFFLFWLTILAAFTPAARAQVEATLVAAEQAVQPGRAFAAALRLEHAPHWHSYWINPGTGYPTDLQWTLPAGWTAGALQWPAPQVIRDPKGVIVGNGYEDVVYLPVTLTPPADLKPGESVTLNASARWLMCEKVCIPGKASLALTLPVVATPPEPDPRHGPAIAATLAALPREIPEWRVRASRAGDTLTLHLTGAPGVSMPAPVQLWFFDYDSVIAFDRPQVLRMGARNEFFLDLPLAPATAQTPARLAGVLRIEGSWTQSGPAAPGLAIDVPIETDAAAAGTPATAAPEAATIKITRATPAGAFVVRSLTGTLALAFLGGVILNLMPCVFPVLGIKILGFVRQSGADRRKVVLHGLTFALGVFVSFWTLAGVLAALRAGGEQLGWGFQLQSPGFVFALAIVMLVFALSLSGVFEFGLAATGAGAGLQTKPGYAGSFFTGVLATVVATPCSAPFLAPALGAALALPTAASFGVFTLIAAGLALPYLLLSIFPQAAKALPRPGAWMETFKQAMAFPLYATTGFLAWVLAGQTAEQTLLFVFLGLTLIAMGAWLYGRCTAPGSSPARARFGRIGGLLLALAGGWLGWPHALPPATVAWEPWSAERVAQLRAENRPVYVDFTARWCFTCQTNKKVVFGSPEVLRQFHAKGVATLRADWTNSDPVITAELARWGRSAVPFNLLYLPGREEPEVLPELLTPGIVLDALNRKN